MSTSKIIRCVECSINDTYRRLYEVCLAEPSELRPIRPCLSTVKSPMGFFDINGRNRVTAQLCAYGAWRWWVVQEIESGSMKGAE